KQIFIHALGGGDHLSASSNGLSANQDGLVAAFGGGFVQPITGHWAVRGSADYVITRHNILGGSSVTQNNFRASGGIVYRFGGGERIHGPHAPHLEAGPSGSVSVPSLGLLASTTSRGVTVVEVAPGSLAEQAGLHVNDVIAEINGQEVKTALELATACAHL